MQELGDSTVLTQPDIVIVPDSPAELAELYPELYSPEPYSVAEPVAPVSIAPITVAKRSRFVVDYLWLALMAARIAIPAAIVVTVAAGLYPMLYVAATSVVSLVAVAVPIVVVGLLAYCVWRAVGTLPAPRAAVIRGGAVKTSAVKCVVELVDRKATTAPHVRAPTAPKPTVATTIATGPRAEVKAVRPTVARIKPKATSGAIGRAAAPIVSPPSGPAVSPWTGRPRSDRSAAPAKSVVAALLGHEPKPRSAVTPTPVTCVVERAPERSKPTTAPARSVMALSLGHEPRPKPAAVQRTAVPTPARSVTESLLGHAPGPRPAPAPRRDQRTAPAMVAVPVSESIAQPRRVKTAPERIREKKIHLSKKDALTVRWLARMRSGEVRQVTDGSWRCGKALCAVALLLDTANPWGWKRTKHFFGEDHRSYRRLKKEYGAKFLDDLIDKNDDGWSFERIADHVEQHESRPIRAWRTF